MSMDLINFVFGAATGVAGNSVYDSIKLILGNNFGQLETFAKNDDTEEFERVLRTVLESNETIKEQLNELLRRQTSVTIEGDVKAEKGSVAAGVINGGTITMNNTFGGDDE